MQQIVVDTDRFEAFVLRVEPQLRRALSGHLPEGQVADALAGLPSGQARAVWLVGACGWTHAEAAEALGISASTVSTQVSRALIRLRTALGVMTDG